MADGPIRRGINERETALQGDVERISKMGPTLQEIASQTAGPEQFNAGEIPSVGYLANLKAGAQAASSLRKDEANRLINRLPGYTKGYRDYLKWRYPTRYGGKGSSNPYGGPTGGVPDWASILNMPGLTEVPGMGQSSKKKNSGGKG